MEIRTINFLASISKGSSISQGVLPTCHLFKLSNQWQQTHFHMFSCLYLFLMSRIKILRDYTFYIPLDSTAKVRNSFVMFINYYGSLSFRSMMLGFFFNCRYVNDGRPFWQYIVSYSTGCSDTQYFEELYNYYTTDKVGSLIE
jgi:hypothetical protein